MGPQSLVNLGRACRCDLGPRPIRQSAVNVRYLLQNGRLRVCGRTPTNGSSWPIAPVRLRPLKPTFAKPGTSSPKAATVEFATFVRSAQL
jgi:hypothetical protein